MIDTSASAQEPRWRRLPEERPRQIIEAAIQEFGDRGLAAARLEDIARRAGKTDDEIKAWLTDRYGDFVLYRPPVKSGTWLLWFGPFALLIVAVAVLLTYLRRRGARTAAAQVTAEEHRRAQALLAEDVRDEAP